MSIVAHVHNLHFAYLVYDHAVVTVVENRWKIEYRIKHFVELVASTHESYQSFHVVEYRPCIVPCISLSKGIAPFQRVKRLLELSVFQSSTHKVALFVENIAIVVGSFLKPAQLFVSLSQPLSHLIYTPVVIGIFKCACHVFAYVYIVRHISEFVIVFMSKSACRLYFGMHIVCSVHDSLPERFKVIFRRVALDNGICHY